MGVGEKHRCATYLYYTHLSVRGPSNQVLSEVLRAGWESAAGLSPLSTPDSILICYRHRSRTRYGNNR